MQFDDGRVIERTKGTPQGGVISPVLANLFLHYVFDKWLQKHHPNMPWCRYADDGLVHCHSAAQAHSILFAIGERFAECGLELHPQKTKIVYCQDDRRKGHYHTTSFDFLGYTFRRRACRGRERLFLGFSPAVSASALKSMRTKIRKSRIRSRTQVDLNAIAKELNPVIRGWLAYYGAFYRSEMYRLIRHVNKTLVRWAMRKYKSLRFSKRRAIAFLERIAQQKPGLFVHWEKGMMGAFA
jgi:RNA-directed DNA polymerase